MLRLIIATIETMKFPPPKLSASFSPESIAVSSDLIAGKRILITGAGGSIGSALARSLATHHPAQILLLESAEQALYQIDRELTATHTPILADYCDKAALEEAFELHHPHIVFHAAAFKHVPLMELHPFAAVQNNAVGTFALAQTAIKYGAKQLILVSTDKAVDPVNLMGVSKRIAELTALALRTPTSKITALRLGNVYGSQGSVVPLFAEQIARGKPVTVTHCDATRYFLTIEQAAALLLLALLPEFSSGILIPELKNPIRIEEIAAALIQQAASSSQIVYTGLRSGEKLHEQLLSVSESILNPLPGPLHAIRSEEISAAEAAETIDELQTAIQQRNLHQLLRTISRLIPSYTPSETLLAQHFAEGCSV